MVYDEDAPVNGSIGIAPVLRNGDIWAIVGVALSERLFSIADWSFAAEMSRMLLIHMFCLAVWRALRKFGTAIAARRPMMATTIMISTSVKPARFLAIFTKTPPPS
jgi:hypothetical protein